MAEEMTMKVKLNPNSAEYQSIKRLFEASKPEHNNILSVT